MAVFAAAAVVLATVACGGDSDHPSSTPTRSVDTRPLPSPVAYRPNPEGVTLADPTFEPIAGAHADFGRLGGSVYQIEMPDNWNGRFLLYMHGYGELASEARVGPPDIRRYLIGHGWAWGASSFSSTMLIPSRAADETAALWDYFAQKYGRPSETYVTGESMGGAATNIAAERYPERFDGALALCGSAGVPTASQTRLTTTSPARTSPASPRTSSTTGRTTTSLSSGSVTVSGPPSSTYCLTEGGKGEARHAEVPASLDVQLVVGFKLVD